jgi:hypothetical protein
MTVQASTLREMVERQGGEVAALRAAATAAEAESLAAKSAAVAARQELMQVWWDGLLFPLMPSSNHGIHINEADSDTYLLPYQLHLPAADTQIVHTPKDVKHLWFRSAAHAGF